jgi:phosphoglycolate phosphatase-like HAD superfamily hydrolase
MALLEVEGIEDGASHVDSVLGELNAALEARKELMAAEGSATPGAREALEAVARQDGVTQSLLTGNIELNAALKLAAFGLEELVDLEIGGYGSDPHRTRSDLVGAAREKAARLRGLQVEAADTVLVGDTPLDVEAAHTAGARAIAVATGPYGVSELQRTGADAVLADLRDTRGLLAAIAG